MRLILIFFSLLVLIPSSILAQSTELITVTGIVVDVDGNPLPGAHVVSKESSTIGTATEVDGTFALKVEKGTVLFVRFLGFKPFEFVANTENIGRIILEEVPFEGDEVVVIGYGTLKKSDLTGSVASVSADNIKSASISSLDQGIQGRVSGVVITQTSGQPGSGTSVRIRGSSSINGSNEPLYVVDGVPILSDASQISAGAVKGPSMNPLTSINPNDVESIEVLKDASATAIYGARGANGVILITTKRGREGRNEIVFDYYTGIQKLSKKIDMLNAKQLAILGNEAADNANVLRRLIYASPNNLGVGTDWQDQIFEVAPMNSYQVSISGGDDNTRYNLSGNYFNQQGIVISSGFNKGNLRFNLDEQIRPNIKIATTLNLNKSSLDGVITDSELAIASSVTSWALEFNPGLNVYDPNGDYTYQNNTSRPAVGNPVADAKSTEQLSKSTRIIGNTALMWDISDSFLFKTSLGIDGFLNEEFYFVPNYLKRAEASNGQASLGNSKGYTWLIENTLNWNQDFNNNSRINVLVGHTLQKFESDFLFAATSDFEDNRLGYHAIQNGSDNTLSLSGTSGWQMQSFLARANYTLKEKYLLTTSARVDGSSKFGDGNKYGVFPSFSSAWKIGQEEFLKNIKPISDLKLRIGYGIVGNEGIPPYSSLGTLEVTEAYFGENEIAKGAGPGTLNNNGLRWETTGQLNIGVDVSLLNYRIKIVADYYIKNTHDLLLNAPVPYTSGFKSAYTNIGELRNEGFEFSIDTYNFVDTFTWNTNFTIGFNKNEITKLTGQDDAGLVGQSILGINGWTRITEGKPIGTFYGYVSNGIIQLDEDLNNVPRFASYIPDYGDRKYVDQNNDNIINESDKVILGDANPDFSFGLSNSMSYKNLSLNVFFQGVYGNEVVNFNRFSLESFDGNKNNSVAALERWTTTNPSNKYPRANALPNSNVLSDVQVEDGSYIRLKDLTLAYNFPKSLVNKAGIGAARLYMSAKNLFTITNYSGYDPEVSRFSNDNLSLGADYGSYPRAKIYMLGINLKF